MTESKTHGQNMDAAVQTVFAVARREAQMLAGMGQAPDFLSALGVICAHVAGLAVASACRAASDPQQALATGMMVMDAHAEARARHQLTLGQRVAATGIPGAVVQARRLAFPKLVADCATKPSPEDRALTLLDSAITEAIYLAAAAGVDPDRVKDVLAFSLTGALADFVEAETTHHSAACAEGHRLRAQHLAVIIRNLAEFMSEHLGLEVQASIQQARPPEPLQ